MCVVSLPRDPFSCHFRLSNAFHSSYNGPFALNICDERTTPTPKHTQIAFYVIWQYLSKSLSPYIIIFWHNKYYVMKEWRTNWYIAHTSQHVSVVIYMEKVAKTSPKSNQFYCMCLTTFQHRSSTIVILRLQSPRLLCACVCASVCECMWDAQFLSIVSIGQQSGCCGGFSSKIHFDTLLLLPSNQFIIAMAKTIYIFFFLSSLEVYDMETYGLCHACETIKNKNHKNFSVSV